MTANLMKPDAFFFTQFFTLGESDLRDLEIIYMDPFDAVLYFMLEFFLLPLFQPFSFFWVATFWWVYAAELTWSSPRPAGLSPTSSLASSQTDGSCEFRANYPNVQ